MVSPEPVVVSVRPGMDDYGWLKFFETIRLTCAHCLREVERTFAMRGGFNPPLPRHCSPKCAKRAFERRSRTRYGHITKAVRRGVYERDGWQCRECGTRGDLTLDHIVPKSKGGTNDPDNLRTLCVRCNNRKGDSL